jgi:hypothetical protein
MTIALEHLHEGDWAGLNRVVDTLRSLVPDAGGVSLAVRVGTATLTWAGGTPFSDFPTVSHGLGKTPTVILPAASSGLAGSKFVLVTAFTYTSTGFTVQGVTDDRSNPAAADNLPRRVARDRLRRT